MKHIAMLLVLLGSACAQDRIAQLNNAGMFDELLAVAPQCKQHIGNVIKYRNVITLHDVDADDLRSCNTAMEAFFSQHPPSNDNDHMKLIRAESLLLVGFAQQDVHERASVRASRP